jgi:hypothetical protein
MKTRRIEDLDPAFKQQTLTADNNGVVWHQATDDAFTVRGLGWFEENNRSFCRLPSRAEKFVRDRVWQLAQAPASARICLRADSTLLALRF